MEKWKGIFVHVPKNPKPPQVSGYFDPKTPMRNTGLFTPPLEGPFWFLGAISFLCLFDEFLIH